MEKIRSLLLRLVDSPWITALAAIVVLVLLVPNVFYHQREPDRAKVEPDGYKAYHPNDSPPKRSPAPKLAPQAPRETVGSTHNVCQLGEGNNCQIQIFFATDRKPSGSVIPAKFFSGKRSESGDPSRLWNFARQHTCGAQSG